MKVADNKGVDTGYKNIGQTTAVGPDGENIAVDVQEPLSPDEMAAKRAEQAEKRRAEQTRMFEEESKANVAAQDKPKPKKKGIIKMALGGLLGFSGLKGYAGKLKQGKIIGLIIGLWDHLKTGAGAGLFASGMKSFKASKVTT